MIRLLLLVTFLAVGQPLRAEMNGGDATDSFDQIMNLRLEVEEKNTLWEQEKKRLQGEYETLVNRVNEVQADVLRKRSQLEILKARGASSMKRSERRQSVSGLDRKNLIEAVAEFKAVQDGIMPFGRSELRLKTNRIAEDLSQGRGSVDEVATEFAQILKSELKLSRGVHLVKEEIQVENEAVPVEVALVGSYTAFFASSDGRVGKWNRTDRRPQWIRDEKEKANMLKQLAVARQASSASRPVILDLDLEAK